MSDQARVETAWKFPGYFPPGENRILPAFYDKFGRGAKPWVLPHPDEVRKQAVLDPSQGSNLFVATNDIVVKWGPQVTTTETIGLLTVDTYVGRDCPVPKVYGWYAEPAVDGGDDTQPPRCTFIYMQHIRGQPLAERQASLKPQELKYIARQLCKAVGAIRSLRPGGDLFVGSIDHAALSDRLLAQHWKYVSTEPGPFTTVAAFHDWLASIAQIRFNLPPETPIQKRSELPRDDMPIVFTHGDLRSAKIMITASDDGPARLAGIVDWSQSGWYPAYWEGWKARLASPEEDADQNWWENVLKEVMSPFDGPQPGLDFFYKVAVKMTADLE